MYLPIKYSSVGPVGFYLLKKNAFEWFIVF